ncbi:serine hydrolase [Terrarubrum flagellatum]|uniref:serine hydrolase n=1 Tax=Terrirubrum flagellatum TaxID=2895980 RepID=UPI0031450B93
MLSSLNHRIAAWAFAMSAMTSISANAGPLPERVEKATRERIAAGVYQTLVFGVVDGDKSEIIAFGRLDDGAAPDGDTVFEIGSITKTFTAAMLAQAALSDRIKLDTPVSQLLPDFKIPSRGGKEITLGELATQHSGLPRLPTNLLGRDPSNPYADYDAAKLKTFLSGYQLPRDPGAAYEYSNLGFGLLGYALAQLDRATYDAFINEQIFKPLEMSMSSVALTPTMRARLARGHDNQGRPTKNWDFDALAGAGAIRSTTNDMLRYLRSNMGASPLASAMKFAQEPRAALAGAGRIGLAWMTTDKGIVWHNGMTGGYASFIGFTSDRRRGIVIFSDTAADLDDLGFATLDERAPLAAAFKAISLPGASLDDYAGLYRLADNFLLNVFQMKDGLHARATGQSALPIFPSAPNEFFARVAGISISFTRDSGGAVNGLVLHQNGDHTAPKLGAGGSTPEFQGVSLDAAALGEYVGEYQFDFGLLDVALNIDHLEAQLTGQPPFPVFASARDEFFYTVVKAQLSFERDAGGKIAAVILHQNGRDARAPRMTSGR